MKKYLNPEIIISNLNEKDVLTSLELVSGVGNDVENNLGGETLIPKN